MTEIEEIFEVIKEISKSKGNIVEDQLLKEVIALVLKNPLDEDRKRCRKQIDAIIREYTKKEVME